MTGDGNDDLVGAFQAVSDEESLCQNVLSWVENHLWHHPGPDAAAVLARLQAEYRERFGQDPKPPWCCGPRPKRGTLAIPLPGRAASRS